ncbi:hypothetical protein [Mycolicibacterium sp. HK-90]|uniref:hypothetical protein n=1 Tax=Mycolicibacterium sp. HK-90 TaxID=3056937 RepID=UPI003463550A
MAAEATVDGQEDAGSGGKLKRKITGPCVMLLTQQSVTVWLFGAILLAVGVVLYFLARMATRREDRLNGRERAGYPGR